MPTPEKHYFAIHSTAYNDTLIIDNMNVEFNSEDDYVFLTPFGELVSKVHFDRGYWWTNDGLQYKASSLVCKGVKS